LEELIPDDHGCRGIDAFVARLDMAGLGFERGVSDFATFQYSVIPSPSSFFVIFTRKKICHGSVAASPICESDVDSGKFRRDSMLRFVNSCYSREVLQVESHSGN
jgi:hypothetical protein